jgi:predicted amidophosphoribosyltransferase
MKPEKPVCESCGEKIKKGEHLCDKCIEQLIEEYNPELE